MQLPALPSLCLSVQPLSRWLVPMSPRGSGRGLAPELEAAVRSPSRLPKAGTGGDIPHPHSRIHRVPRRGGKGWMWRRSAGKWPQLQLRSGGGQRVEGDPSTPPGTVPTAPPAPCSRLRGGLGGVSHSPGAVQRQAESGGRQQQGQGGQQPPPRLSPTSCCQLHLEQTEVPRGQASGADDHGVTGSSGIGPRGAAAAGLGPPEPPSTARGSVSVGEIGRAHV